MHRKFRPRIDRRRPSCVVDHLAFFAARRIPCDKLPAPSAPFAASSSLSSSSSLSPLPSSSAATRRRRRLAVASTRRRRVCAFMSWPWAGNPTHQPMMHGASACASWGREHRMLVAANIAAAAASPHRCTTTAAAPHHHPRLLHLHRSPCRCCRRRRRHRCRRPPDGTYLDISPRLHQRDTTGSARAPGEDQRPREGAPASHRRSEHARPDEIQRSAELEDIAKQRFNATRWYRA